MFSRLPRYSKHPFSHTIPPFLLTCKQIRSEATALIYTNATFDITRVSDVSCITCCIEVESCTTLQIGWVHSSLVAGYVNANRGRPVVPNLKRVEVMWARMRGSESIRVALRVWFNKEDLVVEFKDSRGMLMNW